MAAIRKRGRNYFIRYYDEEGRQRECKVGPDKRVAEELRAAMEVRTARIRAGYLDPKEDAYKRHADRPLIDHLADWKADLIGRGNSARYIQIIHGHADRIITLIGARWIGELAPSGVQSALNVLRTREKLSAQTCNHALRAIKGFSRWLVRDGRARADELAHLRCYNVATDRRHDRRALSPEEATRLIRAAELGPEVHGMAGPDRAALYRLALGTGFRAGELRSLTPESLSLDTDPPTVTVAAGYSKRRREDVQPIRPDLADALRPWVATKSHGQPLFALPHKPAKMMRVDLEAAGIPYKDPSGRVADFHALRHTFVSLLVQSGASVKVAQELSRHSTPSLTIGRYAHTTMQNQAEALAALPDLGLPTPRTEDCDPSDSGRSDKHTSNNFAHILPTLGAAKGRGMSSDVADSPHSGPALNTPKPFPLTDFGGFWQNLTSMHPRGLEPLTLSSED